MRAIDWFVVKWSVHERVRMAQALAVPHRRAECRKPARRRSPQATSAFFPHSLFFPILTGLTSPTINPEPLAPAHHHQPDNQGTKKKQRDFSTEQLFFALLHTKRDPLTAAQAPARCAPGAELEHNT